MIRSQCRQREMTQSKNISLMKRFRMKKALTEMMRKKKMNKSLMIPDQKSHTGCYMTLGSGAVISASKKQKLKTRSSTEVELVATYDGAGPMLWTSRFLLEQGCDVKTMLYQDKMSAILMESNGHSSVEKHSRHLDIRYFFINDLKEKGLVSIKYCPTEEMVADYMTKPLHGSKFTTLCNMIMNLTNQQ